MTVLRLLNFPITLIKRVATGGEDEWGTPVYTDVRTDTMCHYQQLETSDSDLSGDVVWETLEVFLPVDSDVGPYDAVEMALRGEVESFEVTGQPIPELNARTGKPNHLKMSIRRGEV